MEHRPYFDTNLERHDDPARYRLLPDSRVAGGYALLCVQCGRTTYLDMDVQQRYCAHCHEFLDD